MNGSFQPFSDIMKVKSKKDQWFRSTNFIDVMSKPAIIWKSGRILIKEPETLENSLIHPFQLQMEHWDFRNFAFYSIFLCICSYNFNGEC